MDIKDLHVAWLRSSALFTTAHQQLENELLKMRERKVSQDFIDKKDDQIELLVNFYNQTDELLQAYKLALANARMESHFLTQILLKKCTLDDVITYKPTKATKIYNTESGNEHTLSELDG